MTPTGGSQQLASRDNVSPEKLARIKHGHQNLAMTRQRGNRPEAGKRKLADAKYGDPARDGIGQRFVAFKSGKKPVFKLWPDDCAIPGLE